MLCSRSKVAKGGEALCAHAFMLSNYKQQSRLAISTKMLHINFHIKKLTFNPQMKLFQFNHFEIPASLVSIFTLILSIHSLA